MLQKKYKITFFNNFLGTPYWNQGAKKQFYISKRCSTKRECEQIKRKNMPDCHFIWYQDWKCSDCCQGDRCNYYIIVSILLIKIVTSMHIERKINYVSF